MIVSSWDGPAQPETEREPLVVEKGENFFVFDFSAGNVRILTPTGEQSFGVYSSSVPEWVRPDPVGETVAFFDEGSGDLPGELSFEELRSAEAAYWSRETNHPFHAALLFTPDGEQWWVDDFRADVGEDAHVIDMAITSDTVSIAVTTEPRSFSLPQPGGFEIWTAQLP